MARRSDDDRSPGGKTPARKGAGRAPRGKKAPAKPAAPVPAGELEAVLLEANDLFYRALSAGDAAAMRDLWVQADDVMCVHPSGNILRDWDAVGDSWEQILSGTPPKVIPESQEVTVRGEVALVFCIERIISQAGMALAAATNGFQRVDGEWKMLWHHSGLLPSMM